MTETEDQSRDRVPATILLCPVATVERERERERERRGTEGTVNMQKHGFNESLSLDLSRGQCALETHLHENVHVFN